MIKNITTDELKVMTNVEGLVLQGCGGDPGEWVAGINGLLTDEGILLDGGTFKDVYTFSHEGLANMLFIIDDVKLDIGKLAMWRLKSHDTFGGTWLSDYIPNRLGVSIDEKNLEESAELVVENPPQKPDYQIRALLVTNNVPEGIWHEFPSTAYKIGTVLDELNPQNGVIEIYEYTTKGSRNLPRTIAVDSLNELNYLAVLMSEMDTIEREVFDAVLESGKHCTSFKDIINVVKNIDCFYVQPAYNAKQYGEFLVDVAKDNASDVFRKLETSEIPEERDLANHILMLELYVDKEAYARAVIEEEKGIFTKEGYVTEVDRFKDIYKGIENIPDENIIINSHTPKPELGSADKVAVMEDKIQALMDEFYDEWKKGENKGKRKWDILDGFSSAHQVAVVLGNFNYQVENGGIEQWVYNGYFHEDSDRIIGYLEIGAEFDERCQKILDKVNLLDNYANETDCDNYGSYIDEDGDTGSIVDMMDCNAFDTWYYKNCGKENWWEVVCEIIDEVEDRSPSLASKEKPSVLEKLAELRGNAQNEAPTQEKKKSQEQER